MVGGRIASFQRDGSQDVNVDMNVNVDVTIVIHCSQGPHKRNICDFLLLDLP